MISNSDIRRRAREVLGDGIFKEGWLFAVLVVLIVGAINAALSGTYVGPLLASGILSVASAGYFIARVRRQTAPSNLSTAVDAVQGNFVNAILVCLLSTIFVALGIILFIIPGLILATGYSMAYFVMQDNPQLRPIEVLKESWRLTNGHKWKIFCLDLSFIGWMLLGALCFGVGTLWVSAYMETAHAVLYDELVANDRGYFTVNEPAEEPAEATNE